MDFTDDDYELLRQIQNWSWELANDINSPHAGTVQMAAEKFGKEPAFLAELIGTPRKGNCGFYFFWEGPDDDYSKMMLEHDGE